MKIIIICTVTLEKSFGFILGKKFPILLFIGIFGFAFCKLAPLSSYIFSEVIMIKKGIKQNQNEHISDYKSICNT